MLNIDEENFFRKAEAITGLSQEECKEKLSALSCGALNGMNVYQEAGRFPSQAECEVISLFGFEVWRALYHSGK